MRNFVLAVISVILLSYPVGATPLVITGGTYFEGLGGIKYNFFGENFSARGNDTVGFEATVNGVTFGPNDLTSSFTLRPTILSEAFDVQQGPFQANVVQREFDFGGTLRVFSPGVIQSFALEGSGIATVSTLLLPSGGLSQITNASLAFAPPSAVVPEPATWLLLAGGLLAWVAWRYRRVFRPTIMVYLIPWS